jgi:hypothetical protein
VDRLPSNLPINGRSVCRGEVLAGPERRRRWSWKEKAQIVAESLAPGAVASTIARRYGLHPNQLYAWRLLDVLLDPADQPRILSLPLADQGNEVGPRFGEISPIVQPAQFLQAVVVYLARHVVQRTP